MATKGSQVSVTSTDPSVKMIGSISKGSSAKFNS